MCNVEILEILANGERIKLCGNWIQQLARNGRGYLRRRLKSYRASASEFQAKQYLLERSEGLLSEAPHGGFARQPRAPLEYLVGFEHLHIQRTKFAKGRHMNLGRAKSDKSPCALASVRDKKKEVFEKILREARYPVCGIGRAPVRNEHKHQLAFRTHIFRRLNKLSIAVFIDWTIVDDDIGPEQFLNLI